MFYSLLRVSFLIMGRIFFCFAVSLKFYDTRKIWTSHMAQWETIHLPMQEMWVQSLFWEDLLEKEMATDSTILAWEIPRSFGGYSPLAGKRVRHDLVTKQRQ